jgi:hypothetical protein
MLATGISIERHPLMHFMQEAVTMRMLLALAGLIAMLSLGFAAQRLSAKALGCMAGQSALMYPMYDKKGIVVSEVVRCGMPHRGCNQMDDGRHHCSPFMAPKGTF